MTIFSGPAPECDRSGFIFFVVAEVLWGQSGVYFGSVDLLGISKQELLLPEIVAVCCVLLIFPVYRNFLIGQV